jgi:hypothetical protein
MPTSGTFSFDPTADDVLTEAWELLGRGGAEMTGDVARAARRSLFNLLLTWTSIPGLNLWQVDQQSLTLVAGTATYQLAVGTIVPLDLSVQVGATERSLALISRGEYAAIPSKGDRGTPTQVWCDRRARQPAISLYPTPDAPAVLRYWRLRQPQDVGALSNTLDLPLQFLPALSHGLAALLALKFAPDRYAVLAPLAKSMLDVAIAENTERGVPLRITPSLW